MWPPAPEAMPASPPMSDCLPHHEYIAVVDVGEVNQRPAPPIGRAYQARRW
jgi:hypothetical protein